MSLRKIAKEMGISPAYLSYMLNGKRPWREDLRERYAALVNTSVNTSGDGDIKQIKGPPLQMASYSYEIIGGSARESNPPTPLVTRHNGFEVCRKAYQWVLLAVSSLLIISETPACVHLVRSNPRKFVHIPCTFAR